MDIEWTYDKWALSTSNTIKVHQDGNENFIAERGKFLYAAQVGVDRYFWHRPWMEMGDDSRGQLVVLGDDIFEQFSNDTNGLCSREADDI